MADLPPNPDTGDSGVEPDPGSPPNTPRWVKVFGIITAILVLLFVIVMLLPGGHGPGRHVPSGDTGDHTPPIEQVVHQP